MMSGFNLSKSCSVKEAEPQRYKDMSNIDLIDPIPCETLQNPCHTEAAKERADRLSNEIIGACIEVHRVLGPGMLRVRL